MDIEKTQTSTFLYINTLFKRLKEIIKKNESPFILSYHNCLLEQRERNTLTWITLALHYNLYG